MVNSPRSSAVRTEPLATVLDPAALARLEELDPTRANDLLGRVLKAFQSSAARLMPQLEAARLTGDHATVRLVAHTLKSSSASIGAAALSNQCARVETLIRQDTTDGLPAAIDAMAVAMDEALQAIASLLERRTC